MLKKKNDKKYQATHRTASNIPRRGKDTPQKSKAVGSPLDQQKPPYCRTKLNTSNKQERITRLRSDPGRIGRQQRNLSGHPPHARPPSRTAQNRAKPRPSGQALAFRPGDAPSNQDGRRARGATGIVCVMVRHSARKPRITDTRRFHWCLAGGTFSVTGVDWCWRHMVLIALVLAETGKT